MKQDKLFKIILVDDSSVARTLIKKAITEKFKNIQFLEFIDGAVLLAYLEKNCVKDIDLIITDINMPEVNGFDIMRFCVEKDILKHTKLMVISTAREKEDFLRAKKFGVDEYIPKPFDPIGLQKK